jgi:hypothetical protein
VKVNDSELKTCKMLCKTHKYSCTKTYQCKLCVKDDNYDTCKTANVTNSDRESLPSGVQRVRGYDLRGLVHVSLSKLSYEHVIHCLSKWRMDYFLLDYNYGPTFLNVDNTIAPQINCRLLIQRLACYTLVFFLRA